MFESCSPLEGGNDDNDNRAMAPCVEGQFVDLSFFPNTPNMDGVVANKVSSNFSVEDVNTYYVHLL